MSDFLGRHPSIPFKFSILKHQSTLVPTLGVGSSDLCLCMYRVIAHPTVVEWHGENLRQQQQRQEFEDEMDTEEAISSYFQGYS